MSELNTKKIVLLIPNYLGFWPDYIFIYNESVKYNKLIDIIFVTDLEPFRNVAENICFYKISFTELIKNIEEKLDLKTSFLNPIKICDFKPAYGLIFSDLIKEYEFWGYSDFDLIYGDLSKFITEDLLSQFDILSFKEGHVHGPFTIYRNNEFILNLFKTSGFYKTVFSNADYYSFDEFGQKTFYVNIKSKEEILSLPDDNISVIAYKNEFDGQIKVHTKQFCKENLSLSEILFYNKGYVYNYKTNQDYIFYHWVLEKRAIWFKYPDWFINCPKSFYVSVTGFYTVKEFKFYWFIHNWRLLKGFIIWWKLKLLNYIKRKLGIEVMLDTCPKTGWVKKLS